MLAKAFDSVELAVLWGQIHYWTERTNDPEGWVYKSREDIYDETGLKRSSQETARKKGAQLKVLMSERRGHPCTVHFRIDEEKAIEVIEEYYSKHPAEGEKVGIKVEAGLFGKTVNLNRQKTKAALEKSIEYVRDVPEEDLKELAEMYGVTPTFVQARARDVVDYCEAKGKKYSNYKAALRNFIKSHNGREKPRASNVVVAKEGKYAGYGTGK